MSGTVTLESALGVAGSAVSGSYSIQLDDGTNQSGDFNAPACPVPATAPAATCKP